MTERKGGCNSPIKSCGGGGRGDGEVYISIMLLITSIIYITNVFSTWYNVSNGKIS